MQRAALIYNPNSGPRRAERQAQVDAVLEVLHRAGVVADALPTLAPGSAGDQAREAVRQGCDTVIACGGDGTVHEVLQGLVGGSAALGVIPLGTANALAADLALPGSPAAAAQLLLTYEPVCISVGRISFHENDGSTHSRYFTVTAGVGADAQVMYRLDAQLKRRFGYLAYLAECLRVWATHRFPLFEIEVEGPEGKQAAAVSQLLAVRISNFGGVLRRLAQGAALRQDDLRLIAFKTQSRWQYLRFLLVVIAGGEPRVPCIELLDASSVACRPKRDLAVQTDSRNGASAPIYVEADGELLGVLPARIDVVPQALTLLMPPQPARSRTAERCRES